MLLVPQKKSLGQTVFDQVLRRLAVLDRDYFGLQHEDEQKTQVVVILRISHYYVNYVNYVVDGKLCG